MNEKELTIKASELIVELVQIFGFNIAFLNRHFDQIENNLTVLMKIVKFVHYAKYTNDNFFITKDFKNFVQKLIMSKGNYLLLSKDLHKFALSYNQHIGYFDFKKVFSSNKFHYIQILKNNYTDNVLLLNFKGYKVDKSLLYLICTQKTFDFLFEDEFDIINEVFDRTMIKTLNLKVPNKRFISLESLYYEFNIYVNKISVDNEVYSLKRNDFDNTNFIRYLICTYFDYYSNSTNFEDFVKYLENKGYNLINDFDNEFDSQLTFEDYKNYINNNQLGYDLINLVYYNQVINYLELNCKGYDKLINNVKELRQKQMKFDKDIILFIFAKTRKYNEIKKFLKTL